MYFSFDRMTEYSYTLICQLKMNIIFRVGTERSLVEHDGHLKLEAASYCRAHTRNVYLAIKGLSIYVYCYTFLQRIG